MSFNSADNSISEVFPESYWAFFSFVPRDLPWCDWLYFTLHGYPVPAALAVRATRFGFPLPDNISAFPDPNDPSHRENMDAALSRARWLVVVVSPHSAHDPQIDEHIRAFKKGGGEERIIALVVEGEPPSASTLYVKSENRDWLPRWLQWRLGRDGKFQEADRSEPLIIDARPGYSSLDDVMTTLISVLLDVPREELELLEALTKDHGEVARASVVSAREKMVAAAMADFEDEAPARGSSKPAVASSVPEESVRRPGLLLSVGGGLILATIAAVVAFRNVDTRHVPVAPALVMPETPSTPEGRIGSGSTIDVPAPTQSKPELVAAPPQDPPSVVSAPVAMEASPSAATSSDVGGVATPETNAPASDAPPQPEPIDRAKELRVAIDTTTSRAEALLERGAYEDAAAAFEEAIDSARALAGMSGGDPSANLRLAQLCQTLGALQMRIASDAEARGTFEQGLKALGKIRAGKDLARERSRLKIEMDSVLRRLESGINE